MADKSIDIVLNAVDNTGPAAKSASENITSFAHDAQDANETIASSSESGGIASMIADLFELSSVLELAGAAAIGWAIGSTQAFQNAAASVLSTIESMIDGTFSWSEIFMSFMRVLVAEFAIIEYSFKNWEAVGTLVLTTIELYIVKLGAVIEDMFTNVIPTYLEYLWDNWKDIWQTMYDYVRTVIENMYENLVAFFASVISWLQGDGFDFTWTALTEGFESSLKELPQILDREKGPLESQLEGIVGDLSKGIGDGLQDNINKRLGQLPDSIGGIMDAIKGKLGDIIDSPFFKALFGIKDQQQKTGALPDISDERFTTGVQAAGKQDVMFDVLSAVKEGNGIMQGIAGFLKHDISRPIRDGVKGAIQGGAAEGLNLND